MDLIKRYGGILNRKLRPCMFHESEGGGVTDEDLMDDMGDALAFLETDCMTTMEVLKRLHDARIIYRIELGQGGDMNRVLRLHDQYGYVVAKIDHTRISNAIHHTTIIDGIGIDSFLDVYSYHVRPISLRTVIDAFQRGDDIIAHALWGSVQDLSYPEYDPNYTLTLEYYEYEPLSDMTLEEAIEKVR